MEEAATLDQDKLQSVVIPTLNIPRRVNGIVDKNEISNQSQIYVTSAGYKGTFAYEKLIQLLCMTVARPKDAFIFGGDWKIPVMEGLLSANFVNDLKDEGSFNEATFDREFNSNWSGDVETAFFNSDIIDKHRVLKLAEYKYNNRVSSKTFYVMGVDVGRKDCTTEVCIIKVTPRQSGTWDKQIVNIYSYDAEHFGLQTIKLKKLFNQYKCKIAVVDGNGLGAGLIDMLTMDTQDPDTGDTLWNWGVYNDDDGDYKKLQTSETIHNALYIMKANPGLNTEMYSYCQTEMRNGHLKLLVEESVAKANLLEQAQGKKMSAAKRADYLMPYMKTNILKEEMMNLVEENEGQNIILKPYNRKIKHDKFSALIYGLYYCKIYEDKHRKQKSRNITDFMFFTKK